MSFGLHNIGSTKITMGTRLHWMTNKTNYYFGVDMFYGWGHRLWWFIIIWPLYLCKHFPVQSSRTLNYVLSNTQRTEFIWIHLFPTMSTNMETVLLLVKFVSTVVTHLLSLSELWRESGSDVISYITAELWIWAGKQTSDQTQHKHTFNLRSSQKVSLIMYS